MITVFPIDLMIGDIVSINNIPVKVCHITKKKVGYHKSGNIKRLHFARYGEILGITVTPKILITNGFTNVPDNSYFNYIYQNNDANIYIKLFPDHCLIRVNSDIDYHIVFSVDELQRFLRMKEFKTLAKLFKC